MTGKVRLLSPESTVKQAAGLISNEDIGALPVGQDDRLTGVVALADTGRHDTGSSASALKNIGEPTGTGHA